MVSVERGHHEVGGYALLLKLFFLVGLLYLILKVLYLREVFEHLYPYVREYGIVVLVACLALYGVERVKSGRVSLLDGPDLVYVSVEAVDDLGLYVHGGDAEGAYLVVEHGLEILLAVGKPRVAHGVVVAAAHALEGVPDLCEYRQVAGLKSFGKFLLIGFLLVCGYSLKSVYLACEPSYYEAVHAYLYDVIAALDHLVEVCHQELLLLLLLCVLQGGIHVGRDALNVGYELPYLSLVPHLPCGH